MTDLSAELTLRSIVNIRVATPDDIPSLRALIDASARALSVGFYSPEQIEAAVTHVFGVDTQLISDGTYFIIDAPGGPVPPGVAEKLRACLDEIRKVWPRA